MNKKSQRICIVRHGYYPSDPRVYKEVRALADAGYEVDVVCLRETREPLRETMENVRVYRMPHSHRRGSMGRYFFEYGLSMLLMSLVLSVLFLRRWYSVVQVNTLPDSLVFSTLLPRIFGARVLLDMHEPSPELLLTKHANQAPEHMLKLQIFIEKAAIRYANKVMTVNDTIRQRFIERGASASKLFVVRNVPADDFGKNVASAPPHDELVIMTHGTLQPRYGQSVILHALPLIRKEFDSVRLIIAGSGETLDELKELAEDLQCDDITEFTGLVSRDEIASLISQADIGIVPLLPGPFAELCQPNKLFEYIALKTAVIASRLPAIEESFDNQCIHFFDAGDAAGLAQAVIELGRNPSLRQSLSERAYAVYQDLRWSKANRDYVEIVKSMTGKRKNAEF
ncbi:glycosyltransferase family 4 protein [Tichowtungia aerotolerans]|uniref:Glycosyltransferase n=1 Tax=Tichowtungia aerotolerans TaxID=2697043 RepID=A0A6P1MDY0_9BACT|nr:glycosyltransferase family 4 protein [Tichowtungia aerotolerans]QHI70278.1 glycosyltransferase [Tichowtungia aerotolerans]